ncbi:hypothetical protein V3N99_11610 [Dermatophilaceae bacterium Soc4.6]
MSAHLPFVHGHHLGRSFLAACRRGLPDTRDTEYGLGAVTRPSPARTTLAPPPNER